MSKNKVDTKEIGLDIGLIFLGYFLKTDYLHYGYWKDNLTPDIANLKQAQENYTQLLFEYIPAGVKQILDVGCGSGRVAYELVQSGYQVEAVSPSQRLSAHAYKLLGNDFQIYQGKYEEVKIEKQYDLVLFSESFQYIPMEISLQKSYDLLRPNGYVLICDFFQTEAEGKSPLGGGHKWKAFETLLSTLPYKIIHNLDITAEIAPTMTVVNDFTLRVIQPSWYMLLEILETKLPFIAKILKWKYKKKLEKLHNKHFKGERNAENFMKYKTYRLLVLQKQ
ncbi:MAG: class I SAM-dependent methyltransferase [Microscillaceae bacterium]|nr:class I SAM-dependent methyltransferase [Microscillaceae bacterium]MDW8460335.1 class I SAM-dependent methyltransferase [Cytophagales bacterium]